MVETGSLSYPRLKSDDAMSRVITCFPFAQNQAVSDSISKTLMVYRIELVDLFPLGWKLLSVIGMSILLISLFHCIGGSSFPRLFVVFKLLKAPFSLCYEWI